MRQFVQNAQNPHFTRFCKKKVQKTQNVLNIAKILLRGAFGAAKTLGFRRFPKTLTLSGGNPEDQVRGRVSKPRRVRALTTSALNPRRGPVTPLN